MSKFASQLPPSGSWDSIQQVASAQVSPPLEASSPLQGQQPRWPEKLVQIRERSLGVAESRVEMSPRLVDERQLVATNKPVLTD